MALAVVLKPCLARKPRKRQQLLALAFQKIRYLYASVAVRDAPDAVAPAVRAVTAPPDDDVVAVAAPVVADATFLAAVVVVVRLATVRPGVDVAPRDDTPVISDDDTELGIARDAVAPHAHANGANTANK